MTFRAWILLYAEVRVISANGIGEKYSKMDQVKFVEDSP